MEYYLENKSGKYDFISALAKVLTNDKALPVFVCIGSDRVVSDMIGPLIAEFMVSKYSIPAYVYGRLKNPIVSSNLRSAFEYIEKNHKNSQIIVIDASVGKLSDIGKVKLNNFGCIPAGVFASNNKVYGDVSILPVVSTLGISAKTFLSCTKFNKVYELAKDIAESVTCALKLAEIWKRVII